MCSGLKLGNGQGSGGRFFAFQDGRTSYLGGLTKSILLEARLQPILAVDLSNKAIELLGT